jgi:hypothetical protein
MEEEIDYAILDSTCKRMKYEILNMQGSGMLSFMLIYSILLHSLCDYYMAT